MATRRRFFSMLGASAVFAPQLHAQSASEDSPNCLILAPTDTAWQVVSNVRNPLSFNKGEAEPDIDWYLVNNGANERFTGFDAVRVVRVTKARIRILPTGNGRIGARIDCPKLVVSTGGEKTQIVDKDFLLGRETYLDFHFDGGIEPEARLPNVTSFAGISIAQLNDRFTSSLKAANTLELRLVVRDLGVTSAVFDVENLDQALTRAPGAVRDHRRALIAAGKCKSGGGCMMTTAAVGMLGRADDCFELTQMRRLRAAFGHETDVLEAYLTASRHVLSALPSCGVAARVLLFYGAIVWPTALLVRMGAMRAARAWYLGGFRRIMGRFARAAVFKK